MKPALIIGSTVADITVKLPALPSTGQDVHITGQSMSLGGCAFNVSEMLRRFQVPYLLFSPVGTGIYGDFVRQKLSEKQIPICIPAPPEENGCCYCFVEASGERTFASLHGAEYRFLPQWFDLLDHEETGPAYVCGLELEEETGQVILDYLKAHPAPELYFAPGPRIGQIGWEKLSQMLDLSPVMHLNQREALECVQGLRREMQGTCASVDESDVDLSAGDCPSLDLGAALPHLFETARAIQRRTRNVVIITLGSQGAVVCGADGSCLHIPAVPAHQVDTNGAGDSHVGTVIACRMMGMSFADSVRTAARVAAAVVECEGTGLSDEAFCRLGLTPAP